MRKFIARWFPFLAPAPESAESYLFARVDDVFGRFRDAGFEKLTDSEKIFVCVWSLDGELNNGGFDQFFFNESGGLWKQTLDALETIGATVTRGLLSEALTVFPDSDPETDQSSRRERMQRFGDRESDHLAELDARFYAMETENLGSLLHDYLKEKAS